MKKIIWTSEIDLDDYEDYFKESNMEDISDSEKYRIISEDKGLDLDSLRRELDVELDGRILIIGDLGTWRGRVDAYALKSSKNFNEILYSEDDEYEVYYDGYNVKAKGIHHDGTNYYEFREVREDRDIDRFTQMIYDSEIYGRDKVNYYTRSLRKPLKEAMGW